jgi:hypothetical protein
VNSYNNRKEKERKKTGTFDVGLGKERSFFCVVCSLTISFSYIMAGSAKHKQLDFEEALRTKSTPTGLVKQQ